MSVIVRRVPWTVQPQAAVGVNWANPLARGLTLAWTRGVAQTPSGASFAAYGSAAVSRYGVGGKGDGASTFALLPSGVIPASAAYGSGATATGKVTYFALAKIGVATGQAHFFNSANGDGTALGFRTNTTSVGISQASGGSIINFTSAVTAGELVSVCISGRNGDTDFYKNGQFVSNSAVSYAGGITSSAGAIGRSGTSTQYGDHEIYLLLAFNRGLSRSEGQSLTANPWQLFAPLPRTIWAPAAAGGVSGTLATTNANDTSSAAGTTTVTGTLATTNANDTLAASGSAGSAVTGTLATTNANDTSAASGTTTVTGTVAYTNANDTAAASGWAGIVSGALAATNSNDTISAAGDAGALARRHAGGYKLRKGYLIKGRRYFLSDDELAVHIAHMLQEVSRGEVKEITAGKPKVISKRTWDAIRPMERLTALSDMLATETIAEDDDEETLLMLM